MSTVPTVEVVHGDGVCIINESDFDPKVHTRSKGRGATKPAVPTTQATHKGLPTRSSP